MCIIMQALSTGICANREPCPADWWMRAGHAALTRLRTSGTGTGNGRRTAASRSPTGGRASRRGNLARRGHVGVPVSRRSWGNNDPERTLLTSPSFPSTTGMREVSRPVVASGSARFRRRLLRCGCTRLRHPQRPPCLGLRPLDSWRDPRRSAKLPVAA